MSSFVYPHTYLVYLLDDSENSWVPGLFAHREVAYFLSSDSLEDLLRGGGLSTGTPEAQLILTS